MTCRTIKNSAGDYTRSDGVREVSVRYFDHLRGWGVDCTCEVDGALMPIHISSWLTLTAAAREKTLQLVQHSTRLFEV